jgi:hypothetical protein
MLLILDIQEGLYSLARDFDATLYRDAIIAHSALGQVFDIPVVMSTSAQQGQKDPTKSLFWLGDFIFPFRLG